MQESSYNQLAWNRYCGVSNLKYPEKTCVWVDIGIAQINYKTALSYNFDMRLLVQDLEYSIDAGAKVLAWFHRKYAQDEPKRWWSRYNCGTKKSVNRTTCDNYYKAVNRWK